LTERTKNDRTPFHNLYRHGFARVAVAVPRCRVADPDFNAAETVALMDEAARRGAVLVAFPELGLPAYTCDDLFHQKSLLDACERALGSVVEASKRCAAVALVGLPVRVDHLLFNCAAVVHDGRVLGWCRRPTCPTTASSTRRASSIRPTMPRPWT
jgi:NAD+ synthase (glutamine-hydrolysing)